MSIKLVHYRGKFIIDSVVLQTRQPSRRLFDISKCVTRFSLLKCSSENHEIQNYTISCSHHALLLLVTFINQLMHSIDTVVDVKICVV